MKTDAEILKRGKTMSRTPRKRAILLYVEVDIDHDDGHIYCVTSATIVTCTRDRYGEDADGNRGEWRTDLEFEHDILAVERYDGEGESVTTSEVRPSDFGKAEWDDVFPNLWEELDKAAEIELENAGD